MQYCLCCVAVAGVGRRRGERVPRHVRGAIAAAPPAVRRRARGGRARGGWGGRTLRRPPRPRVIVKAVPHTHHRLLTDLH